MRAVVVGVVVVVVVVVVNFFDIAVSAIRSSGITF